MARDTTTFYRVGQAAEVICLSFSRKNEMVEGK